MDSVAIAWWKRPDLAITIDYGQHAAKGEIQASAQVAKELRIAHEVVRVDCSPLGSGDMAGVAADHAAPTSEWWPYRNQLLITLVGMRAIARQVETLFIGTVRSDGSNHADGTPQFVQKMDELMTYQEGHLRVSAPAIEYSTAELVQHAEVPPGLLAWAHSCHKADIACGNCRGCNKYRETYLELGPEYWGE
jgi:7-cyano-7-deazaguanine synthase